MVRDGSGNVVGNVTGNAATSATTATTTTTISRLDICTTNLNYTADNGAGSIFRAGSNLLSIQYNNANGHHSLEFTNSGTGATTSMGQCPWLMRATGLASTISRTTMRASRVRRVAERPNSLPTMAPAMGCSSTSAGRRRPRLLVRPHRRRDRPQGRRPAGKRWWLRLHEKGGKRHDVPVHHTLEGYLDAYIDTAGIREERKGPLFRTLMRSPGTTCGTRSRAGSSWPASTCALCRSSWGTRRSP